MPSDTGPGTAIVRHRINAARLRLELLRRGLDGQTFACQAGVSAATISHVLNGRVANPRTIVKIASALARIRPLAGFEGDMLELVPQVTPMALGDRSPCPTVSTPL